MVLHICSDEIGMIGLAITAIGGLIKPVRDCAKCYAIYLFNRMRGK